MVVAQVHAGIDAAVEGVLLRVGSPRPHHRRIVVEILEDHIQRVYRQRVHQFLMGSDIHRHLEEAVLQLHLVLESSHNLVDVAHSHDGRLALSSPLMGILHLVVHEEGQSHTDCCTKGGQQQFLEPSYSCQITPELGHLEFHVHFLWNY